MNEPEPAAHMILLALIQEDSQQYINTPIKLIELSGSSQGGPGVPLTDRGSSKHQRVALAPPKRDGKFNKQRMHNNSRAIANPGPGLASTLG